MMKYLISCFAMLTFLANSVEAGVYCSNVDVKIDTSTTADFHHFSETGAKGSILFIKVPPTNCSVTGTDTLATNIYIVIDSLDNLSGLQEIWVSMLLSAEARSKTISINASNRGVNQHGFQVIEPYRLKVD